MKETETETETRAMYDIGDGLRAECVGVGYLDGETMSIVDTACWELYLDEKPLIAKFVHYERINGVTDLFDLFDGEIRDILGDDHADWIRAVRSGAAAYTPPWERIISARKFRRYSHTFDDDGNANRFEDECRGWLIYDNSSEQWFAWCGNHWEPAKERVKKAARFVGRSVADEEQKWEDPDRNNKVPQQYYDHRYRSANLGAQNAMLSMAAANMTVDMQAASDMSLLACKNGIVDCRSGTFYPMWECEQFRYRYPTAYVDAAYIPKSRPDEWIEHLLTVMDDNTTEGLDDAERDARKFDLVKYLLRIFGYMLYPGNPERIFVFFWGRGRNGKSTTTQVLLRILGSQAANPTLAQLYAADSDRPAPSIAAALPKRLAVFSEADGDAPVSVSAFKELTGETSTERFRRMHQDNVRTPIYCLPMGTTNDIPQFDRLVDQALLNRLITIPFRHVFSDETRDVSLELAAERDEIFSLMVDELRKYLSEGLLPVHTCARATQMELLVGDELYRYFSSALESTDGCRPGDRMTRAELKQHYLSWAVAMGADIDTRTVRDEGDQFVKVLTKKETNRLFAAVRVMGYEEVKVMGVRYVKCRPSTSPQKRLIS